MIDGFQKVTSDLVFVQQTEPKWVALLKHVHADFQRIDSKGRARIERYFEHFGNPDASLPKEHFAQEGRHPIGGAPRKEVLLWAFKAFQVRLYGIIANYSTPVARRAVFIGLHLIDDKKSNKADQALLKRVALGLQKYRD